MKRLLDVWWDGRLVGHLTQDEHGDLGFGYAPAWLHDASAAMSPGQSNFSLRGNGRLRRIPDTP